MGTLSSAWTINNHLGYDIMNITVLTNRDLISWYEISRYENRVLTYTECFFVLFFFFFFFFYKRIVVV